MHRRARDAGRRGAQEGAGRGNRGRGCQGRRSPHSRKSRFETGLIDYFLLKDPTGGGAHVTVRDVRAAAEPANSSWSTELSTGTRDAQLRAAPCASIPRGQGAWDALGPPPWAGARRSPRGACGCGEGGACELGGCGPGSPRRIRGSASLASAPSPPPRPLLATALCQCSPRHRM